MKAKIVTYVDRDHLDVLVSALREAKVNRIGNYVNCMSWGPVTSTWTSLEGATPFIGEPGEVSVELEYRLEMICERVEAPRIANIIKMAHPYEAPEIDVFELLDV